MPTAKEYLELLRGMPRPFQVVVARSAAERFGVTPETEAAEKLSAYVRAMRSMASFYAEQEDTTPEGWMEEIGRYSSEWESSAGSQRREAQELGLDMLRMAPERGAAPRAQRESVTPRVRRPRVTPGETDELGRPVRWQGVYVPPLDAEGWPDSQRYFGFDAAWWREQAAFVDMQDSFYAKLGQQVAEAAARAQADGGQGPPAGWQGMGSMRSTPLSSDPLRVVAPINLAAKGAIVGKSGPGLGQMRVRMGQFGGSSKGEPRDIFEEIKRVILENYDRLRIGDRNPEPTGTLRKSIEQATVEYTNWREAKDSSGVSKVTVTLAEIQRKAHPRERNAPPTTWQYGPLVFSGRKAINMIDARGTTPLYRYAGPIGAPGSKVRVMRFRNHNGMLVNRTQVAAAPALDALAFSDAQLTSLTRVVAASIKDGIIQTVASSAEGA